MLHLCLAEGGLSQIVGRWCCGAHPLLVALPETTSYQGMVTLLQAKAYLTSALRASVPLRIGTGPSRPLNHAFQTADWAAAGSGKQQDGRRLAPSQLQLYAVTDAACDARQARDIRHNTIGSLSAPP